MKFFSNLFDEISDSPAILIMFSLAVILETIRDGFNIFSIILTLLWIYTLVTSIINYRRKY